MQEVVNQIVNDSRYVANIEYGKPRGGHPEGTVKNHIAELLRNLETLHAYLPDESYYWKLQFLIHVHDLFKAEAHKGTPILHPQSHASLARTFAAEFTDNTDLLNMIQYHDEGYALWRRFDHDGCYDVKRFEKLLNIIEDWNLFLLFNIIDNGTKGKDPAPVQWFLHEVAQHRSISFDENLPDLLRNR